MQTMCRNNVQTGSYHDNILNWCPSSSSSHGWFTSAQAQKEKFPATRQLPMHGYLFFQKGGAGVGGERWRSLVTLHVPVCARLHLQLSSHLTGLSVSTADQDASLSLTGWTDSAAIQTDSSSGSWWREGWEGGKEEGIWGREARQRLLKSKGHTHTTKRGVN